MKPWKKAIIAILCALLASICACGQAAPEEVATVTTTEATTEPATETTFEEFAIYAGIVQDYLEEYNELLNEENRFMDPHYYFLYDIDGNGTKELLVGMEMWDQIYFYVVYTIIDGVMALQEEFTWNYFFGPPPVLFKNGTIRAISDDGKNYSYYRFENGALRLQVRLRKSSSGYKRTDGRSGDSRKITIIGFKLAQKEFEGDGQVVEFDWKPLAEYGR